MFTTPWISVSVTMSPLATCVISWPSTASTSLRLMLCRRPELTATSAASRRAPVAKAFGSGESNTPTSGMPMPACVASWRTVPTSHSSFAFAGLSMTRTPMARLAIHLEMPSEISAPPNPNTAAMTSRPV